MLLTKNRLAQFRLRYGRYRILSAILLVLFVLSAVLAVFFSAFPPALITLHPVSFSSFLMPLLWSEATFFLLVFLLGVTIYAPACALAAAILRGAWAGGAIRLFLPLETVRETFLLLTLLLYLIASFWIYAGYAAFCGSVSLRLFSDNSLAAPASQTKKMFGGSLFYSSYFCGAINLRFLSSYCLVFLAALTLSFFCTLLYALLRVFLFG